MNNNKDDEWILKILFLALFGKNLFEDNEGEDKE